MRTVICCLNSKYIHASLAPWCLKAAVEEYCKNIECTVIESTINRDISLPLEDIKKINPKIVGLSTYIWNIDKTLELCKLIKETLKDVVIVLGGPEVSYRAGSVLESYPFIDYVVSGEGERPFAWLCNAIKNGETAENIDGVSYRKNDKIIESQPNIETDEPISPYCNEFFQNLNGRISYIESSRGCPYSCAFCLSGRCGSVRFFDIEKTKQNIISLSKSGTKTVKFVDRTFNANLSRAKEIWRFIIDSYKKEINKGVCFHFEIAGDILDDEAISLLSSAPKGLIQLEIGMQSFNEQTLSAIRRKTNVTRLKENIKKLITPRNMHIHIDLIAGLPYEDIKSFKNSFNTAFSLKADMLQMGFLKLLYGAPMREEPQNFPCEFQKNAPYTVTETPWLSSKEIADLHRMEDAFQRLYGSGRFKFTLKYLIDILKFDPFDLFFNLGQSLKTVEGVSLNDYVVAVYKELSKLEGVDLATLRDLLAADKLVSDKSGKLPEMLKIKDKRIKASKSFVREKIGNTASAALIYSSTAAEILCGKAAPIILSVDYTDKDEITGRYKPYFFDASVIEL